MGQKRFGPSIGAGTVVIEKEAEKQIEKGALGVTGYAGIMEKGPVGELFLASSKSDFLKKAGSFIDDSLLPDSAFDFFSLGRGAGELYCLRVTDGSELKAELKLKSRQKKAIDKDLSHDASGQYIFLASADYIAMGSPVAGKRMIVKNDSANSGIRYISGVTLDNPSAGYVRVALDGAALDAYSLLTNSEARAYSSASNSEVAKIEAHNGGSWGGKKDIIFGLAFGGGGLTETTYDTGAAMLKDFYKGAVLSFAGMPGLSYEVISNDAAGVLTVSSDALMASDYSASGSSDETWKLKLDNNDKALSVKIFDGSLNPSTEFGMKVYCDGIEVLYYENLSMDSSSEYYYESLINDDGNNDYIVVTNLWSGALSADIRPASIFGQSIALSDTTLQGDNVIISKKNGAGSMTGDGSIDSFSYGGDAQEDQISVKCTNAGSQASGSILISDNAFDGVGAIITGADVTASYALGNFSACAHDKFNINLYGQGEVLVTLALASCTTGANTATEMTTKINAAIATAGYVGTVLVTYSTDHLIITSVAKGFGLAVVATDTGASGGSFASEAKLTLATYSNYSAGSGDYVRFNFGGSNIDYIWVDGIVPSSDLHVPIAGSAIASATAFVGKFNGHAESSGKATASNGGGSSATIAIISDIPSLASGWSIVESDGATDNMTIVDFAGGANQVWSYTSLALGLISGANPITGTLFSAPNDFGIGFLIHDGAIDFAVGDEFVLDVKPWEVNAMVGGKLLPDCVNSKRDGFVIVSNTADSITVKSASLMLGSASLGASFRVEFADELGGGYDGISDIADADYIAAFDSANSQFNNLFGMDKGLVKLAIPGVTSSAVQNAGQEYAEARNYQFRVEIPNNIVSEDDAEAYINDTIGRNDFSVTSFPSYMYVSHPTASGLKLVSATGAIHGREALFAKNYQGYHKAAAGIDATISNCIKLPTGDKTLNEEILNRYGIGILKFKNGNCIIWGDRTLSIDPSWKWKHQRELMSYYENDMREKFDWLIFSINDKNSDKIAKAALESYFRPEHKKRALRGEEFEDACSIKLDDENNTNATRAAGDKHAEIGLRLADTTERFIITMSKMGIFDNVG